MKLSAKYFFIVFILISVVTSIIMSSPAANETKKISGTIYFEDGKTLDFLDLTSLIFILKEGAESIPQNVSEWPVSFDKISRSRSIPLSWVKSIEVLSYETKERYRCLFNPVVLIKSVTGVELKSEYKTLEWIKVKAIDDSSGEVKERYVYFADVGVYLVKDVPGKINIRKIVLNN